MITARRQREAELRHQVGSMVHIEQRVDHDVIEREGHLLTLPEAGLRRRGWLIQGMAARLLLFRAAMIKNRALFAAQMQIVTQVIESFRRESIRFMTKPFALSARLIWQEYPTGAII